jgi:hypothetical protein
MENKTILENEIVGVGGGVICIVRLYVYYNITWLRFTTVVWSQIDAVFVIIY